MTYGEQVLGELRLLEAFGVYPRSDTGVEETLRWRPRFRLDVRALDTAREAILAAGAPFNLRHGWRRISASLRTAFTSSVPEYDWFDDVPEAAR